MYQANQPVVYQPERFQLRGLGMLNYISTSTDGWMTLVVVLIPTLAFIWIIMTVTALHKRDVYFWSLGSTWSSLIACPIALLIIVLSGGWKGATAMVMAGAVFYAVAFAYSIFYNYNATKSAALALSTSMLQQLAVLGAIYLFFRLTDNEENRGR
jgi:ABC-type iron transport system FetAB permease component